MTDHQQAALTAMQDEIYRQLNCQYGDFNTPSNEEVKAILAAAEPHLRKKVRAEELVERIGASNLGAAPGEDEGAVQEFLEFVHTSMDVVRIECIALNTPGEWPRVAEFRVESRNDDGGTEIEHWSVQKAMV